MRHTIGAAVALLLALTALSGTTPARAASKPLSVVQLGDSIASGEGTLYGYTYDPTTRRWTGGNLDATWQGPYQGCHVSPAAYGNVVARTLHARFTTFACTGASYTNGIIAAQVSHGLLTTTTLRPAQFGDWANQRDLNPAYDAARPDLVLITLGADDLEFTHVVQDCVTNAIAHSLGVEALRCTATNSGPTITTDFTANLGGLGPHYQALINAVQARGRAAHRVPKIVFTTYHDPLPMGSITCPDVAFLDPTQVAYLRTLVPTLDTTIRSTINRLHAPGVAVADTSKAMVAANGTNHRWCSPQPWAYGLSIFTVTDPRSLTSQAPFHPTPDGQRRYAALVTPVARTVLGSS
jgi:GDSL-like Lipase/Acylhydrolase family